MSDIQELTAKIRKIADDRDWHQFHNAKDLSISLLLEATELLEHFQWRNGTELEEHIKKNKQAISEELVDVLYWVLRTADVLDVDLKKTLEEKLVKIEKKYPIEKAKGNHKKYTEL
jgi:dCTP diphosphatase